MHYTYVLILGLVLANSIHTMYYDPEQESGTLSSRATAVQMAAYHEAASSFCEANSAACAGTVEIPNASVRGEMLGSIAGGAAYATNYRSFSLGGGQIVTIYSYGNYNPGAGNAYLKLRSTINWALHTDLSHRYYAGGYDRGNQRLGNIKGDFISIPNSIAGVSIFNDVPMLASD